MKLQRIILVPSLIQPYSWLYSAYNGTKGVMINVWPSSPAGKRVNTLYSYIVRTWRNSLVVSWIKHFQKKKLFIFNLVCALYPARCYGSHSAYIYCATLVNLRSHSLQELLLIRTRWPPLCWCGIYYGDKSQQRHARRNASYGHDCGQHDVHRVVGSSWRIVFDSIDQQVPNRRPTG